MTETEEEVRFFFQAEPALMYDSVQVFAVGLMTLEQSHALRPANISCELEHPWDGGLSLINYINSVRFIHLHVNVTVVEKPRDFAERARIVFACCVKYHNFPPSFAL